MSRFIGHSAGSLKNNRWPHWMNTSVCNHATRHIESGSQSRYTDLLLTMQCLASRKGMKHRRDQCNLVSQAAVYSCLRHIAEEKLQQDWQCLKLTRLYAQDQDIRFKGQQWSRLWSAELLAIWSSQTGVIAVVQRLKISGENACSELTDITVV